MVEVVKRKARSPYQRYSKTPFQYHLSLKSWREAIKENRRADADKHRAVHDAFLRTLRGRPSVAPEAIAAE